MSARTRRIVLGILLGYVFLVAFTVATFSLALVAPDFARRNGNTDVRPAFITYTLVMGIAGAFMAGHIAARIARDGHALAVRTLAVLVLVLGIVNVIVQQRNAATGVSGTGGAEPLWYSLLVPVLGAAAVLAGGFGWKVRRAATRGAVVPS
jgi:hypothetical protein